MTCANETCSLFLFQVWSIVEIRSDAAAHAATVWLRRRLSSMTLPVTWPKIGQQHPITGRARRQTIWLPGRINGRITITATSGLIVWPS